jgi:RHS repeat-associated protein
VSYSVVDGESASYSYYPDGTVSTIEWSPVAGNFSFVYNLRGQTTQIEFPNGQRRDYSYDAQGRLLQVANIDPSGGNLATFDYGYDVDYATGLPQELGQRTSMTANFPAQGLANASTKYYYDADYQLVRADYSQGPPFNGETDEWNYDLIGNRVSTAASGVSSTYSYQKIAGNSNNWQRLLSDGANTYSYDANGNTVTRTGSAGSFSFTSSVDNRLTAISGGEAASYKYDFRGRRTSETLVGGSTTFLYRDSDLIGESGAGVASYLVGPTIDEPLAMLKDGQLLHLVVDGLGSILGTSDSAGVMVHSNIFDAWGRVGAENGSRIQPFTFTGRELGGAGTLYFRARYYDPSIGRFTQEDPLGVDSHATSEAASQWLYVYSGNDPASFIDPSGLRRRGPAPARPQRIPCDSLWHLVNSNNPCSGLAGEVVMCIILKESGADPNAQNSGSSASGLMQITRATAKQQRCEFKKLLEPGANIDCGARDLCWLMKNFTGGDVRKAVALYMPGPGGPPNDDYANDVYDCVDCLSSTPCKDCQKCNPNN